MKCAIGFVASETRLTINMQNSAFLLLSIITRRMKDTNFIPTFPHNRASNGGEPLNTVEVSLSKALIR